MSRSIHLKHAWYLLHWVFHTDTKFIFGRETFTFRAVNHDTAGAVCIFHPYFPSGSVPSYPVRKAGGETIISNTAKRKCKEGLNCLFLSTENKYKINILSFYDHITDLWIFSNPNKSQFIFHLLTVILSHWAILFSEVSLYPPQTTHKKPQINFE